MKSNIAWIVTLFISMTFFAAPAYSRPIPPKDLLAIFNDFSELEESFENEEWDEALKDAQLIRDRFNRILPELRKTSSANLVEDFTIRMEGLKRSISDRNVQSTLIVYIALQNMFFRIMDDYEYKLPPVIKVIDTYIAEALDGLRHKEFDKVVREMEEVVSFVQNHAEKHLKDRVGAAEIDDFKKTLIEVKYAAKNKNHDGTLQGLKKLKKISERFVKLF